MAQPTAKKATTEHSPAKKKRGALLVHERLREDIQWLRIEPGSALDEVALARQFEVSRTPIREALLLLSNEGFVQFLQNRTTIVAPLSLFNLSAFTDTLILLSRGMVRAATLQGQADKSTLDAFVADYSNALEQGEDEAAFHVQLEFFRHIASLARNRFLEKYFLEAQDASVRTKLLYFFPHLSGKDRLEAIRRLQSISNAVLAGEADESDAATRDAILFEVDVIQRGLGPRFGHEMTLGPSTRSEEEGA
ncbi:GntR family transcriptional regulator [Roseivivax sp. GX 12232]|uniref:GntR family transcriptional regulator n=1 Tax=Roseivivax sp. GX 12232 TaxID=2900547 RepID=UPI001E57F302|nr:GntR family transcriptional regulator [Roseivivax sp. GX 12232]MCE0507315.1 GntR family transcriptional regulator [Roseivivax sp. GX 12232]